MYIRKTWIIRSPPLCIIVSLWGTRLGVIHTTNKWRKDRDCYAILFLQAPGLIF